MANNTNNKKNQKKKGPNLIWLYLAILAFLAFIVIKNPGGPGSGFGAVTKGKDLSYTKFTSYIENDFVESIVVDDNLKAQAVISKDKIAVVFGNVDTDKVTNATVTTQVPSVVEFSQYMDEVNKSRSETGLSSIDVTFENNKSYWWMILVNALPFVIFFLFIFWMGRGLGKGGVNGGVFGVGKANAKIFDKDKKDKVTFKDVAGLEGAKQEVKEIVDFLKNPKKYTDLGGKIPKGALLVGPPGTGKTLLAKAVAGEANVPFFSMSGSDFVEMFVGVGASRVRDLFRQAQEKAPSIIFIDEIDAVGRARGKNIMSGGNDERESTLNQLLTEMDGFGTNSGVIILAATNRADVLDPALLRAGRFDRQIHVDLPDLQERAEIFAVHLKPLKLAEDVEVDFLAKQSAGFSGADIANLCNEAALIAARNNKKKVDKQDFMNAVDRIVGGLEKKTKVITGEEKRSIAYHEAGHATVSWLLRWGEPLVKVTIVPRGVALGAAWYLPEERPLTSKDQMLDDICSLLGGRAAEELFLGQTCTGAINDLERATKLCYAMVTYYGMSDKLANLSYYDNTGRYDYQRPYSDKTAELIDKEVANMLAEQMQRAKQVLQDNAEKHNQIANLLIENEVITADDVEAVLGPRPWKSRQDQLMEDNEKHLKLQEEKALENNATQTETTNQTDNNIITDTNEENYSLPADTESAGPEQ